MAVNPIDATGVISEAPFSGVLLQQANHEENSLSQAQEAASAQSRDDPAAHTDQPRFPSRRPRRAMLAMSVVERRRNRNQTQGLSAEPVPLSVVDSARGFLDAYLGTAVAVDYGSIRQFQDPPHGSVAYGAAGLAYALFRLARRLGSPELLARAHRLIHEINASRDRSCFDRPHVVVPPASVWCGEIGVAFVQCLVANALGENREARRAARRFEQLARRSRATGELMLGSAGCLCAATELDLDVADALAKSMLDRLSHHEARIERAESWSFAHGWPGMYFALMQFAQARRQELPAHLNARLARHASRPARFASTSPDREKMFLSSWCNGHAGHLLLWSKAYEYYGDSRYLDRARDAASALVRARDTAYATLCCGHTGRAYALARLHAVDPSQGWMRHARRIAKAALAAATPGISESPSGLSWGYPGVACLAGDLLTDIWRFPVVEPTT